MNLQTTTLKISGMHCTSCAMSIDFELEDIAGVKKTTTSYAKQTVQITYDPTLVSLDRIQSAIASLGYSTSPA